MVAWSCSEFFFVILVVASCIQISAENPSLVRSVDIDDEDQPWNRDETKEDDQGPGEEEEEKEPDKQKLFEKLFESVDRRLKNIRFSKVLDVDDVLGAIDGYYWDELKPQRHAYTGDVQSAILEEVVSEWVKKKDELGKVKNQVRAVEFGSYVGYSAMRIYRNLPSGSSLLCVEQRYDIQAFRVVVDQLLSWARMKKIEFSPMKINDALRSFQGTFDVVHTDRVMSRKFDQMKILESMITSGRLSYGALYIANNVAEGKMMNLLKYLRFSGMFVDYRLYYTEAEYSQVQRPDAIVFATFVSTGRGKSFDSPGGPKCAKFGGCAACLANLCGWCAKVAQGRQIASRCVPDVPGGGKKACGVPSSLLGVHGVSLQCPQYKLQPRSWIGPADASGQPRRGSSVKKTIGGGGATLSRYITHKGEM